jgi:hypothetical protein
MEHIWIEDELYDANEIFTHTRKWDCKNCIATKHEWLKMKDGKIEKHYYVLVGNTQYGLEYKCSNNKKNNTGKIIFNI